MDNNNKNFLLTPTGKSSNADNSQHLLNPKIDLSKVRGDSEDESILSDQEAHLTPGNLISSIQRDNSKLFQTSTKSIPAEVIGDSLRQVPNINESFLTDKSTLSVNKSVGINPEHRRRSNIQTTVNPNVKFDVPSRKSTMEKRKDSTARPLRDDEASPPHRTDNSVIIEPQMLNDKKGSSQSDYSGIQPIDKKKKSLFEFAGAKRGSKEIAPLTQNQMALIDDKGHADKNKRKMRSSSMHESSPRKAGTYQLLDRISRIAARRESLGNNEKNAAQILTEALKKVNPEKLHKAERKLRWSFLRKMKRGIKRYAKAPFQVFTPDDNFTIIWTFIMMVLLLFDVLLTPFELSFFGKDRDDKVLMTFFPILESIFFVDMIINFRTAFYDKGMLMTNSRQIFHYYLKQGFALDFIAFLANIIATFSFSTNIWYFKFFKIVRVKKLSFMIKRFEDFLNIQKSVSATLKLFKLWGTILIVGHWIACLFHILAFQRQEKYDTWLDKAHLVYSNVFERYVAAFYWAVMTMTTVGYGDIGPTTAIERLFTILAMIIACALFGYTMNTIGTIFHEINSEKIAAKEKIRSVKNYMNQKNLGRNIQTRVKNYLQYMIDSKTFHKHDEEEFFKMLSQALKDEIISEVNGRILVECKIFSTNFSHKAAMYLARFMQEKFLSPEEILFNEDDEDDCGIYFISYGKIQIYHRNKVVAQLDKGAYFGELSFFSGQPRAASVKSLFFSSLFCLKREDGLDRVKAFPSDFEQFHVIKDDLNNYCNYTLLETKCYSCGDIGHISKSCPKVHFIYEREIVIKNHIEEEKIFRKQYRRRNRTRFHAILQSALLHENAQQIQQDYEDDEISEGELSQDSLDLVLERNLFVIPAAEQNDLKMRKLDRRRKSHRFSAQVFMEEVNFVNDMIGDKAAAGNSLAPTLANHFVKGPTQNDFLFFSIDKVENFEVYYPHNNINKLIRDFEKKRISNLEATADGKMKNLFLKNLSAFRKSKNSPLSRKKTVKFTKEESTPLIARLQTEMHRISKEKKELKRKETLGANKAEQEPKKQLKIPGAPKNSDPIHEVKEKSKTEDYSSSSDDDAATIPKEEARQMERKGRNFMNTMNAKPHLRAPSQPLIRFPNELGLGNKSHASNNTVSLRFNQPSMSDAVSALTPFESLNISSIAKIDLFNRRMSKSPSSIKLSSVISSNLQEIAQRKRMSIENHFGKRMSIENNTFDPRPLGRKTTSIETPIPEYPNFLLGKSREFAYLLTDKAEKEKVTEGIDEAILLTLIQDVKEGEQEMPKLKRAVSFDRMDQMKKVVDKYQIPQVVQKMMNEYQVKGPMIFNPLNNT